MALIVEYSSIMVSIYKVAVTVSFINYDICYSMHVVRHLVFHLTSIR